MTKTSKSPKILAATLAALLLGPAAVVGPAPFFAAYAEGGGGGGGGEGPSPSQSLAEDAQRAWQRNRADRAELDRQRLELERNRSRTRTATRPPPSRPAAQPDPHTGITTFDKPGPWHVEFYAPGTPAPPEGWTRRQTLPNGWQIYSGYRDGTVVVRGPNGEGMRRFIPRPLPTSR